METNKDKDALMMQVVLALAKGCGDAQVSDEACSWFHQRYYSWIDKEKTNKEAAGRRPIDVWDESSKDFFARFTEIGRKAAEASGGGTIDAKILSDSSLSVENNLPAPCPWCPNRE